MARGADSAGYCQTDACHVPLPQIQNGECKAYALKSKELTGPTKGVIFLEIDVIFNAVSLSFAFLSLLPDFLFLFCPPPPIILSCSPQHHPPLLRCCCLYSVCHPPSLASRLIPRPLSLILVLALIIEDSLSAAFVRPFTIAVCVPLVAILQLSLALSLASDMGHALCLCCHVVPLHSLFKKKRSETIKIHWSLSHHLRFTPPLVFIPGEGRSQDADSYWAKVYRGGASSVQAGTSWAKLCLLPLRLIFICVHHRTPYSA